MPSHSGICILRQAYLANLVVSGVCYMALWSFAPSLPQMISSFEQDIRLYAASDVFLGPLLYKALSPRAH